MDDCKLSDVVVKDQRHLGIEVFILDDRICLLDNYHAELLMRWIASKLGYEIVNPHE